MNKKIISLLVLVCMVFSSFAAFAEVSDNANVELPDSDNLKFAKTLGLLDESLIGTDTFTRAQLARLVSSIMFYHSGVETEYMPYVPTDVDSDLAPYVSAAISAGILNGNGDGTFSPNAELTYIQLVKTFVVLLGRKAEAESKGGYPAGYYATATGMGLTKLAPPDMNYKVTVAGVADMLRLAVSVDMAELSFDQKLEILDENYLSYYCSIYYVKGMVDGVCGVSLNGSVSDGKISIDKTEYSAPESVLIDSSSLGLNVEAFYTKDGSKRKILYMESCGNNVVTIEPEDLASVSPDNITYISNDKEVKLKITTDTILIYNNEVLTSYNPSLITPFIIKSQDGYVELVDNNDDLKYDIIKVRAYDSYVVDSVERGVIYNKYHGDTVIDTKKLDDVSVVNAIDQPISPDLITKGDVLSVMRDTSGNITKIIVTIEKYTGTLNSIQNENGKPYIIEVDGNKFKISFGFGKSPNTDDLKLGEEITVYFNHEGRVCEVESDAADSYRIGYLIDAGSEGIMDETYRMKLLGSDGKISIYNLTDKVEIEVASRTEGKKKADEAIAIAGTSNGRVKRQPILYRLNADKQIKWIRYSGDSTDTTVDGFFRLPDVSKTTPYYLRSDSFGGQLLMSSSTVMFRVPAESERDDDTAYGKHTNIGDSTNFDLFTGYGVKANSPMMRIMVFELSQSSYTAPDDGENIFVIKSVTNVFNDDYDKVVKLTGVTQSGEATANLLPEIAAGLKPGDIIQMGPEVEGCVRQINKVFTESTRKMGQKYDGTAYANPTNRVFYTSNRFVYGKAYWADNDAFTLKVLNETNNEYEVELSYITSKYKLIVVDTTGREIDVYSTTKSNILSEIEYGDKATNLFVHSHNSTPRAIVIYK